MSTPKATSADDSRSMWVRIRKESRAYDVDLPLPIAVAKLIARKCLPESLRGWASGVFFTYLKHRIRRPQLVLPIAKQLNFTVQAGPFAGIVYPPDIIGTDGLFVSKLLGCYEMECNNFVEQICSRSYDQVINIGAAEGYYAVGLSRRMPSVKVFAFETQAESRELCAKLARMNGMEGQIEVRGTCLPESLAAVLESGTTRDKHTLIVCDCEGAEMELLRPEAIPALKKADLLIELHDTVDSDISPTMSARFAPTHQLERVGGLDRDPDAYPALSGLRRADRMFLLSEHRKEKMDWMFCSAKA